MKTIIRIITVLVIIVGCVWYDYSIYNEMIQNDTETSVFADVTDQPTSTITGDQVMDYIGIPEHKWSSHTIRFSNITNYTFESTWKAHINKEYQIFANPYRRDKRIKYLKYQLDSTMVALYANDGTRNESCIYEPIMRELNRLSHSNAHHKTMIIQSDLGMNSELFSVFRTSDVLELKQHTERIIERFENIVKPNDLKGIEVMFVYKCKDVETNMRYNLMLDLMRKILITHGASVTNGATLIR